jgi:hypothetical protein
MALNPNTGRILRYPSVGDTVLLSWTGAFSFIAGTPPSSESFTYGDMASPKACVFDTVLTTFSPYAETMTFKLLEYVAYTPNSYRRCDVIYGPDHFVRLDIYHNRPYPPRTHGMTLIYGKSSSEKSVLGTYDSIVSASGFHSSLTPYVITSMPSSVTVSLP